MGEDQEIRTRTADQDDGRGPADVSARSVKSREDLLAELSGFIAKSPGIFGGVDIFNIDYLHPLERAGMLAAVLTGVMTADRRPAVRAIVVVAAPGIDIEAAHARTWGTLLSTFQLLSGREMSAAAQAWFRVRFKVISAPDLSTRSLLAIPAGF